MQEGDGKDCSEKVFLSLHSSTHLSIEVALRTIKVYKDCAPYFIFQACF